MKLQKKSSISKNLILILIWLSFTSSLAVWWWVYGLRELHHSISLHPDYNSKYNMIMIEGFILVLMIILGGGYLIYLTFRDQKRNDRLHFFFSAFSHDIKTSISRLRLQSDLILEKSRFDSVIQRLSQDIQKLDLQLENSLAFTNPEHVVFEEDFLLSSLIKILRPEFPDLKFELQQDFKVFSDQKAMTIILRNLFHNSLVHGKADLIKMEFFEKNKHLRISDNGLGFKGNVHLLGQDILSSENAQGNGLGLYITKRLSGQLGWKIKFSSDANGFHCDLHFERVAP